MINPSRLGVLVALLLACVSCQPASATLMAIRQESCPLCGAQVVLKDMVSFGTYIFDEPSKYDLIFPPESYKSFFVACGTCGYTQTAEDFLSPTPDQIQKLRQSKLITEWKPASGEIPFADRLERTILVNRELERPKEFWACFVRIHIHHLRELDPDKAKEVAKEALRLVEQDDSLRRKHHLYLLGEYSRLSGDMLEAKRLLRKAGSTSINRELILPLVSLHGAVILCGGVAIRRCQGRFARGAMVGLVAAVLIGSLVIYSGARGSNDYLDQIIQDRIQLLAEPGDQTPPKRTGEEGNR